jgi:hypothetical protein
VELRSTAATVKTPAENFTGAVYLKMIFGSNGTSRLVVRLVRFAPGARTNCYRPAGGIHRQQQGAPAATTSPGWAGQHPPSFDSPPKVGESSRTV